MNVNSVEKTKYFFPEQAIGAKCECEETNIDLNNTWCEATEENEKYLYKNVSKNTHNLNKEKYFILEKVHNKLDVRTINYIPNSNYRQIHLINGKFEFIKEKPKQWYEIESNFPCIVMYEEKELVHMRSYKKYSKHRQEPCLLTSEGGVYYSLSKCRPATKEEILSLFVK